MPLHFSQRAAECNPSDPPDDPTPEDGYGGYFYWDPAQGDLQNNAQRQAAVDRAAQGVVRMVAGIPVCLFALLEALIYLAFTLAAAALFFSVPVAMLCAFFRSTELIAVGLVRAYVALFVKTFAVSALMTLFFSFLLWFAQAGNWGAFMAVAIVMALFALQFLGLALSTVRGSLDPLTASVATALGAPASASQGLATARLAAGAGLAATQRGAGLAASGGAGLSRALGTAAGGTLGLAVATAGLVAGRATGARLAGLTGGRLVGRARVSSAFTPAPAGGVEQPGAGGTRAPALPGAGAETGAGRRDSRAGARISAAVARAAQRADDPAAVRRALARTGLAVAERDALAGLIGARPVEAQAVTRAVAETLAARPELTYLAEGQLDPASPGVRAVLERLQTRLPEDAIGRLRDDPAGRRELGLLVGARLGLEREWGPADLQREIAAAARAGGGVDTLTAQLRVAPHAFGADHAAVDHFVRELGALGLTRPEDVGATISLARAVRRGSPTGDLGAGSRQRALRGKVAALGAFERRLEHAASRSAVATGGADPRVAERQIQRLLRDAGQIPTTLAAQVTPDLVARAPQPGRPAAPARARETSAGAAADAPRTARTGPPAAPEPPTAAGAGARRSNSGGGPAAVGAPAGSEAAAGLPPEGSDPRGAAPRTTTSRRRRGCPARPAPRAKIQRNRAAPYPRAAMRTARRRPAPGRGRGRRSDDRRRKSTRVVRDRRTCGGPGRAADGRRVRVARGWAGAHGIRARRARGVVRPARAAGTNGRRLAPRRPGPGPGAGRDAGRGVPATPTRMTASRPRRSRSGPGRPSRMRSARRATPTGSASSGAGVRATRSRWRTRAVGPRPTCISSRRTARR